MYFNTTDQLFLAMSQFRLKQPAEARKTLQAALNVMETRFPKEDSKNIGPGWNDWLICQIIRREAVALIPVTAEAAPKVE